MTDNPQSATSGDKVKSLFGNAAKLAQKQAALTKINSVSLPRLYHAIGKRIVAMKNLPAELAPLRDKITQLETALSANDEQLEKPNALGLAAKAKQLAAQATKAAGDAAASVQLHAAFVSLGKKAVDTYGEKAVPKDLAAELSSLLVQQKTLQAEVGQLKNSQSLGVITVPRLAFAGVAACLLIGFFVLRTTASALFSAGDSSVGVVRKESSSASPDTTVRTDRGPSGGTNKSKKAEQAFREEVSGILDTWKQKAKEQALPIAQSYLLATADSKDNARKWAASADAEDRKLQAEYAQAEQMVSKAAEEAVADYLRQSETKSLSDSEAGKLTRALHAVCDKQYQQLMALREAAGTRVRDHLTGLQQDQRRLEEALQTRLRGRLTKWRDELLASAALGGEKTLAGLAPLKNSAAWKSEQDNALEDYKHHIRSLATQEEQTIPTFARDAASGLEKKGDIDRVLEAALREFEAKLARCVDGLKAEREKALAKLVAAHARIGEQTTKAQMDRDAEIARQKKVAGRSFGGPKGLTDDALIESLRIAPNITDVALADSPLLTDKSIPAIAALEDLRSLILPKECEMTVKGLQPLRGRKLREVRLPEKLIDTPEGFDLFVSMLGQPETCGPGYSLAALGSGADGKLRPWDLYHLSFGDEAIHSLKGAKGVTRLGTPEKLTDAGMEALAALPDLEVLYLHLNAAITNRGIAALRKCPKLKVLIVIDDRKARAFNAPQAANKSGAKVDANGLVALKGLGLREIELPCRMLTEEYFEPFLDALSAETGDGPDNTGRTRHSVSIGRASGSQSLLAWPCTPKVFQAMSGKRGIRKVHIEACECTDRMLATLKDIPDLEDLWLDELPVDGSGVESLSACDQLDKVFVTQCPQFSDAGVRAIARCKNLREVHLIDLPRVTDAGVVALGDLAPHAKLKKLLVQGTSVTAVAAVKLENMLPDCHVSVSGSK